MNIEEVKPLQIKSRNVKQHPYETVKETPKASTNQYSDYLEKNVRERNFFLIGDGKKAELELISDNSISKNIIVIGRNASLRLFITIISDSMNDIEIRAQENSELNVGFLKHKGAFAYHRQTIMAETASTINSASFWAGNGFGESITELRGVGSNTLHICLSSAGNREESTINSDILHYANNTSSEIIMRGVAEDSSKTIFNGRVAVETSGRGSKSNLEQQILLLDEDAKAEANPILEIKNNDVDCSHSAAVRQLDEEKLFYLMSRGLEKSMAKTTMMTGFLRSSMNKIQNKELRNMFMPPFMRD
ncbi:SufD family Fe-S cluster assembly protein [Candidatus Micrarchaeota archaeon]|nr:SufD family Fe-S cluster assembly protein [Candidatus Micrarchaeota archaeon]